jgi:hypothetical protein
MTAYTGRSDPATILRIKLIEVLYVSWVRQWYSILRSQVDATRMVDLCYPEGALPTGGELVGALLGKYVPEH